MFMLALDPETRQELWQRLIAIVEDYAANIHSARVTPDLDPERIRCLLRKVDFRTPLQPIEALDFAADNLWRFQVHTPHPRYYGLYNPAPTAMGIAADTLVAAFNPQLAAWSHSPFAAEVEAHLVRAFGERFGYDPGSADGTFASGGAEANHTAVLTALAHAFPKYLDEGARALPAPPVLYGSEESHHSVVKAARVSGIGVKAVRQVPVGKDLRMDPAALAACIAGDRAAGFAPFLVMATAGTTSAGLVDPIRPIADIAEREGLWLHVDAAWGGAAVLLPKLRGILDGIARADSITFDAHKWFSVPMSAGIYLTRHPEVLTHTFSTPTAYMPRDAHGLSVTEPHLRSLQWSRRFIGLKVFLSLLVAGWDGYAAAIDHMTEMGDLLRHELQAAGWEIRNDTPLPVVCFADPGLGDQEPIARAVLQSGEAWISTTRLRGELVLRACITNYRTDEEDIRALIRSLDHARGRSRAAR